MIGLSSLFFVGSTDFEAGLHSLTDHNSKILRRSKDAPVQVRSTGFGIRQSCLELHSQSCVTLSKFSDLSEP